MERSVLQALPLGFCLFDPGQTLVQLNEAFCRGIGLAQDALSRGMSLPDTMRVLAYQGVFGPGDPEGQAMDAARIDPGRPRRLRRARPDGGAHELTLTVLPDGFFLATVIEVSALLRQREAAEERQALLAATIEALPHGIARFDAARVLLFSSRRFATLLGLSAELLRPGLPFAELERLLRDTADVEGFEAIASPGQGLAAQLERAGFAEGAAQRCSRRDGSLIDIAATRLAAGGWAVTATDVSPEAGAEDAARRRGKLLGAVLERLPQGLCLFGADRRVGQFNRAFTQLLPEAAVRVGDRWDAFATRLEAASLALPGAPAIRPDPREPQGWRHQRPDGSATDLRLIPLPNGGTACVATAAAVADDPVSAARLQDMEAMLTSIRHGIVLWTHDRDLVASSRIAATLLGLPEGLLMRGRPQAELLAAMAEQGKFGPREQAAVLLGPLASRDIDHAFVEDITDSAGRRIEIRSDPVPDDGFIWTCTDVTDRFAADEELRRAREAAEAASLAKSSFLATMSHELRTPLNAVIGFSETLSREANDRVEPGRVAEFANAINDAGKHLLNLVNNILDVARIEAGRFDLASDRIDLGHLVAMCVRQAATSARAAEVTLHADLPRDLPGLRGDERRLRQVLAHLVNNAIKFTDSGGSVRIDASLRPSGADAAGDLLISVSDTGIGIPEADLQRVFEPFTQVDNGLARRAGGSGLGLYFARALVAAHGGDLSLASRPGKGTTAVIRLPRSRLIEERR